MTKALACVKASGGHANSCTGYPSLSVGARNIRPSSFATAMNSSRLSSRMGPESLPTPPSTDGTPCSSTSSACGPCA
eukprot:scaffold228470_cov35-Tisochrysis_lutea.AAC.2